MAMTRKGGTTRTDFWLSDEDRRVLDELRELTGAQNNTRVLRYLLRSAAIAAGITPPRTPGIQFATLVAQNRANNLKGKTK